MIPSFYFWQEVLLIIMKPASGSYQPPNLEWQSSLGTTTKFTEVVSSFTKLTFNYPTYQATSSAKEVPLVFYLYGEADPDYNWPSDLTFSTIQCDAENVTPRTCSFTISTEDFTSFRADVIANHAFYDDWTDQPDSSHWRDHVVRSENAQNYYTLDITTVDACLDSTFPGTPLISQEHLDFYPLIDDTVLIDVAWAKDTDGATSGSGGCGVYNLKLLQSTTEPAYDQTTTMIAVQDSHHFSFKSTEVVPADTFFKTYNFNGWIESTRVNTPSPPFTWSVNVFDTCAAFFEMIWSSFSDINLTIGRETSATQQIATFTQTLKRDKKLDLELDCGEAEFEISVDHDDSAKSQALRNLISISASGSKTIQVNLLIDPISDVSLVGDYIVRVTGRLRYHTQTSYQTSFKITLTDSCLEWPYPDAPVLSNSVAYYQVGQGDLTVGVAWTTGKTQDGVICQGHEIVITPSKQNAMFAINTSHTRTRQTSANQFIFSTDQSDLAGSVLVYDVAIKSKKLNIVSAASTLTVYLEATSRKLPSCKVTTSWVQSVTQSLTYDIRAPPASTTLATVTYIGPPLSCGTPVLTYTNAGAPLSFLTSTFNSTSLVMGIVLTTPSNAVRGTYVISATFTAPGASVSPTGLTLTVINSCDTTVFASAPTFSVSGSTYYHGQGTLAVPVSYAPDSKACGGYTIQITLDTVASTITGGTVNSALINATQTTPNNFNFIANQPGLSGTLKYNVKIGVSGATAFSQTAVWSVNLFSCNQKASDWISARSPIQSVDYDVKNPPTSAVIATYAYLGPPFSPCGNPVATIANDATGASLSFLTATYDSVTKNIAISLPNNSTAVKGVYSLRIVFSMPGNFNFSLGLSLNVFDICDIDYFDSAPLLTQYNQCYYPGQGDLVVTATYTDYAFRTKGTYCGPYDIVKSLVSSTLTTDVSQLSAQMVQNIDDTHFKFNCAQTGLNGELQYNVQIESRKFTAKSPSSNWKVNICSCSFKENEWVIPQSTVQNVLYDIRNPPTSSTIATYAYFGPPTGPCGSPVVTFADAFGQTIPFLNATFTKTGNGGSITVSLPTPSQAVKGVYNVSLVFTQPGSYSYLIGVNLTVVDTCDDFLQSAPVLTPDNQAYRTTQGDLVIQVAYLPAQLLSSGVCGTFTIVASLNSGSSSTYGDLLDNSLTNVVAINQTSVKFSSKQPGLGGTLKYDVIVYSSRSSTPSPVTVWTVNPRMDCSYKYSEWITPQNTPQSLSYDLRNTSQPSLLAKVLYQGPPLSICGNPVITISSTDGSSLGFLTATFDSASGNIAISLPSGTSVAKNIYSLVAVFSQPGNYSFNLGLDLNVFDSCDNSTFDEPPLLTTLSSSNQCYYAGQGDLVIQANYSDVISKTTGFNCGPYTITTSYNSANSTINGNPILGAPTLAAPKDQNHFKFAFNQPDASGELQYDVQISSRSFNSKSPKTPWKVNVCRCNIQQQDWIRPSTNYQNFGYDLHNPPASSVLTTFSYYGPPLGPCGRPEITLTDAQGQPLTFLTASYVSNGNGNNGDIVVQLPDQGLAVKGSYDLKAIFTHPGDYTYSLGIGLDVFDICDGYSVDQAPVLSHENQNYQTGQGDLDIDAIYLNTNNCDGLSIVVQFNSDASTVDGEPVDTEQTHLIVLNSTKLKFSSSQSAMSGTLKYNVMIMSSEGIQLSPIAVWTINIKQRCDQKYKNWINPSIPARTFDYDIRSPPSSPVIANYPYFGPTTCGNPTIDIVDQSGSILSFISTNVDLVMGNLEISIPNTWTVEKGTYYLDAAFSYPGSFSFALGFNLNVFDSCESSSFMDAPDVTDHNDCYYPGQGDLVIKTTYADFVSQTSGISCGPYQITATLNSANSTINGNPLLGSIPQLAAVQDQNHFKFAVSQPNLSGQFTYDVVISSRSFPSKSPKSSWKVKVCNCNNKDYEWIEPSFPVQSLAYNLRNPPSSRIIASYPYLGPPLGPCGVPNVQVTDSNGVIIPFLTATYVSNGSSKKGDIVIQLPDPSLAVKGFYDLTAFFTLPGNYAYSLGLLLTVYDVCDSYTLDSAPVLNPENISYWTGQGDLVVSLSYPNEDNCGPYSINVEYDSDASATEGDPIDSTLTNLVAVGDKNIKFFSNQPSFSGTLKYYVSIVSPTFNQPSPSAVWTVTIEKRCDQKYRDWIIAKNPVQSYFYDVRNPPQSPIIATYPYYGPPEESCGAPVIEVVSSEGTNLDFLTAGFDSVYYNQLDIFLRNNNTAVKGSYLLRAVFTQPGAFSFALGLNLTVYDSCDSSSFVDPPIVPDNGTCYYPGQGPLLVQTSYSDTVSLATGQSCGPYTIRATLNSGLSTINGNPALGSIPFLAAVRDEHHFKFQVDQHDLSGEITYDVQVSSQSFTTASPKATWKQKICDCRIKEQDWVRPNDPVVTVDYDIRNPPASTLIATYSYYGPSLKGCGNPFIIIIDDSGSYISFLTVDFTPSGNANNGNGNNNAGVINIYLPDNNAAVRGNYNLTAAFYQPGTYNFTLGLVLNVFDICDSFVLLAPPILSPNNQSYWYGQGELAIQSNYLKNDQCGDYIIDIRYNSTASSIQGDPIDQSLTNLVAINSDNMRFFMDQPALSGVLKFDVRIVSTLYVNPSPKAVWIIFIQQRCDQKYNNWLSPTIPTRNVYYDVRNPPTTPIIATYVYYGPQVDTCGTPVISVASSNGTDLVFLTANLNTDSTNVEITLPNNNTAIKGSYLLQAVFTQPGTYSFALGLNLTVYDSCDNSSFYPPDVPDDDKCYYPGQGNLAVSVKYFDTVSQNRNQTCGPYKIVAVLNSDSSTINGNPALGAIPYLAAVQDQNTFLFSLTQPDLSGVVTYNVQVVSSSFTEPSPTVLWQQKICSCNQKYWDWVNKTDPVEYFAYDVRNPPVSPIIGNYSYWGPPIYPCGIPDIYFADEFGNDLPFLTAVYTDTSDRNNNDNNNGNNNVGEQGYFTIYLLDSTIAVKGTFDVQAVFSYPGQFNFQLGLILTVFDICDNSYFATPPVLSPDNQIYQIGEEPLVVSVQYFNDYITQTTSNICGEYSIVIQFNSDESTIEGGPIDPQLTRFEVLNEDSLQFYTNQPRLNGILKYNVKIVSSDFIEASPITTWTLNLLTCDQKYKNWINAKDPIRTFNYDLTNPPTETALATYEYFGPSIESCGNPTISLANSEGLEIGFLTADFDPITRNITVSLPDKSVAVKGTYYLQAQFNQPGSFSFGLGLTLRVYQICDDSYFESAPFLQPDEPDYYVGQGDLVVDVSYVGDYIQRLRGGNCGPFTIVTELNSNASTIYSDSVIASQTTLITTDPHTLTFNSVQNKLNAILKYDVKIVSTAFFFVSPISVWTVNVYSCTSNRKGDWLIPNYPVETVVYDYKIPPLSNVLDTFTYTGPPLQACGPPSIKLEDDRGNSLNFLKADYVDGQIVISIDKDAAVAGTFNVVAAFQHPGVYKQQLGLIAEILASDVCNLTTIQTGGTYQKMTYITQQSAPTVQSLIAPHITYFYGGSASECGGVVYEIDSVGWYTNSSSSLGNDLQIDQANNQIVLKSIKSDIYRAKVKVSLERYPQISATSDGFIVQVADCADISITPVDESAPTTVTYGLYDPAISRRYILAGYFDLCDGVVDLSLSDLTNGRQAPSIFKSNYSPDDYTIEVSVETQDRTFLGNYQIVLSFTLPAVKTLPTSSYLLDITITDPCDDDIWTDSDFGVLAYTIGGPSLTKTIDVSNKLSANFCEFEVVYLKDDWSNNFVESEIVSAVNTNTSLTLRTQTDDNSKRKQYHILNVVLQLKSPYYTRTWQTTGKINLTDPCFENSVVAIPSQSFPLSNKVTFTTSSNDKVSQDYNRPNWCGQIVAQSISCSQNLVTSIGTDTKAIIELGWSKEAITSFSCSVTYGTEYGVKTWIGDEFRVEITDPCVNQSLMQFSTSNQLSISSEPFTFRLCQSEDSTLSFTYSQDPISIASGIPNFCGQPSFTFKQDQTDPDYRDYTKTNLIIVDSGNFNGQLQLSGNLCQRQAIGSYKGWIERRYRTNTFLTDRSVDLTFTVTDPCGQVNFSEQQTFFPANSQPYLYLVGQEAITFNITGGYFQDDISAASGEDYFCGFPTFKYVVKSYSDQQELDPEQQQWISLVKQDNEFSTYENNQDIILTIRTQDAQQNGVYFVEMIADLGDNLLIVYDEQIIVQVSDDECVFSTWADVDFGTLDYNIGSMVMLTEQTTNTRELQNCQLESVSFVDNEGTVAEWFSAVQGSGNQVGLELYLSNTNKKEFWSTSESFSLSFTYTMRAKGSTLFSFVVNGVIQFTNECLSTTISTLSLPSKSLAGQVTFTPDLTTLKDSVSERYDIIGLCGDFTLNSAICENLPNPNILDQQQLVLLDLNWDQAYIGDFNCVVDFKSTSASNYYPAQNDVIWPSQDIVVITLTNPCLENSAVVTFESTLVNYDVCQNETVTGASFTFTDTVSTLSQTPNYCGDAAVSAVFVEEYSQTVTDAFKLYSFAENNAGYITFDPRVCDRDLARPEPYQVKLELSYTNGEVSTLTDQAIDIKLNDPCAYKKMENQKFFDQSIYNLNTYGESLVFNLSSSYLADNVTIWSGIDYFCGYPTYEVFVTNDTGNTVFDSSSRESDRNFTSLINKLSYPPDNFTTLVLNSTDNSDFDSQYVMVVQATVEDSKVSQSAGLQVFDACISTKMVDSIILTNMTYLIGASGVSQTFFTSPDTISASFLSDKNINNECGNQVVTCQVVNTTRSSFLTFNQDATNSSLYNITVKSDSSSDVGVWRVRCSASLFSYPLITPITKLFTVTITQTIVQTVVSGPCVGSPDFETCQKFIDLNPPYFSEYTDSQNQFSQVDPYSLTIENFYALNGNNITISTVSSDFTDPQMLRDYLIASITSEEDPVFQRNIRAISNNNVQSQPLTYDIYCPQDYESTVVRLTLALSWKGVPNKVNRYQLPLYCMPCDDPEKCSNTSPTYYETYENWRDRIRPINNSIPIVPPNETIPVITEVQVQPQPVSVLNTDVKPIDRSDPEIQVPGESGTTYLDFSYNALVPISLPNGQIIQVVMCAPDVESISNTGQVTIRFSKPIEPVDPNLYEEIALSGVIQANLMLGTEVQPDNVDAAQQAYSFNFTITDITADNLFLQLEFSNPEAISSSGTTADRIQISFVNSKRYFKCQSSIPAEFQGGRLLQQVNAPSADTAIPNGFRVQYPIPSQTDPIKGVRMTRIVGQLAQAANAFVFIAVISALIFEFRIDTLWGFINALQIVCCMSYCNLSWPVNMGFYFTLLNSISQFDFLDPFNRLPSGKEIANWKWSPTDPKGSSLALANGGSLTFLPNLGSVALFLLVALIYTLLVPIGKLISRFNLCGKKGAAFAKKVTPNTDKLISQWIRIFVEIFLMLYMFLLLGFEMARQLEKERRTSFDKWSIATQSALIVPIFGLALLTIFYSVYYSRWFVSYYKTKFFLVYQDKLHQEQVLEALERAKTSNLQGSVVPIDNQKIELESSVRKTSALASLIPVSADQGQEKSIVVNFADDVDIERFGADGPIINSERKNLNGEPLDNHIIKVSEVDSEKYALQRKASRFDKFSVFIKRKVRQNLNERLEAMQVKHHELEEDQKEKLPRLKSYDKYATLHKEMNHHCYKAQYYWTFFLLRRFIFISVCVKSSDSYWQSSTFIVLSMVTGAYLYAIFPFKYDRKNYVENFNEAVIFLCGIMMQCLSGFTMNASIGSGGKGSISAGARARAGMANFVLACISFIVAVNFFFFASDISHQVHLHLKKLYLKLKAIHKANILLIEKQKAIAKKAQYLDEVNQSERKLISQNPFMNVSHQVDQSQNIISGSSMLPEEPEVKKVPIHREAFAIVSYDPMARILDDDEYSSIRSAPAPDENQFRKVISSQPRITKDVNGELIEMKNFSRVDSNQQSRPDGDVIITDSSGNVSNVEYNYKKNQPVGHAINISGEQVAPFSSKRVQKLNQRVVDQTISIHEESRVVMDLTRDYKDRSKVQVLKDKSRRAQTARRTRDATSPSKIERSGKFDVNRSAELLDEDQLVSVESESIKYYDQARSRMNDTHRKTDQQSDQSRQQMSDESDFEISNRSISEDYRGDLKSHRVINQSEIKNTERGETSIITSGAVRIGQANDVQSKNQRQVSDVQLDNATVNESSMYQMTNRTVGLNNRNNVNFNQPFKTKEKLVAESRSIDAVDEQRLEQQQQQFKQKNQHAANFVIESISNESSLQMTNRSFGEDNRANIKFNQPFMDRDQRANDTLNLTDADFLMQGYSKVVPSKNQRELSAVLLDIDTISNESSYQITNRSIQGQDHRGDIKNNRPFINNDQNVTNLSVQNAVRLGAANDVTTKNQRDVSAVNLDVESKSDVSSNEITNRSFQGQDNRKNINKNRPFIGEDQSATNQSISNAVRLGIVNDVSTKNHRDVSTVQFDVGTNSDDSSLEITNRSIQGKDNRQNINNNIPFAGQDKSVASVSASNSVRLGSLHDIPTKNQRNVSSVELDVGAVSDQSSQQITNRSFEGYDNRIDIKINMPGTQNQQQVSSSNKSSQNGKKGSGKAYANMKKKNAHVSNFQIETISEEDSVLMTDRSFDDDLRPKIKVNQPFVAINQRTDESHILQNVVRMGEVRAVPTKNFRQSSDVYSEVASESNASSIAITNRSYIGQDNRGDLKSNKAINQTVEERNRSAVQSVRGAGKGSANQAVPTKNQREVSAALIDQPSFSDESSIQMITNRSLLTDHRGDIKFNRFVNQSMKDETLEGDLTNQGIVRITAGQGVSTKNKRDVSAVLIDVESNESSAQMITNRSVITDKRGEIQNNRFYANKLQTQTSMSITDNNMLEGTARVDGKNNVPTKNQRVVSEAQIEIEGSSDESAIDVTVRSKAKDNRNDTIRNRPINQPQMETLNFEDNLVRKVNGWVDSNKEVPTKNQRDVSAVQMGASSVSFESGEQVRRNSHQSEEESQVIINPRQERLRRQQADLMQEAAGFNYDQVEEIDGFMVKFESASVSRESNVEITNRSFVEDRDLVIARMINELDKTGKTNPENDPVEDSGVVSRD